MSLRWRLGSVGALVLLLSVWISSGVSANCIGEPAVLESDQLRVVTLNIAHGRRDARNQVFLSEDTIRGNLLDLGVLMDRAEADMIALQEADAESWWSGDFNHVDLLRDNTMYGCALHGIHASNRIYDFGTALLSPHPLRQLPEYLFHNRSY